MIGDSISKKVMAGYVVILLAVLVAGLFMFQKSSYIGKTNRVFTNELLPELQSIEFISKEVSELQLFAYALYGTTISTEQFAQHYKNSKAKLTKELPQLGTSVLSVDSLFVELFQVIDSLNTAMQNNQVDWDEAREHLEVLQSIKNKLDTQLTEVENKIQKKALNDSNYIQQQIVGMHRSIVLVGIFILFIIVVAFYISRRGIVIPARDLSQQLAAISSSMDLTNQVNIFSKDELLDIANALNILIVTFKSNTQTSKHSAKALAVAAESLEQLSSTVKQEIANFRNDINVLNQQVNSVESSIIAASEKSQAASDIALTGAEQAQSSAQRVNHAARGIDELSQDLQLSSDMLTALKVSGDQVGAVVKTIADIAEQLRLHEQVSQVVALL